MSLPIEFSQGLRSRYPDSFEEVLAAFDSPRAHSVLLHPDKVLPPQLEGQEQVPWSIHGCYLKERPSFIADPFYHAGHYYSQDASSMVIERLLAQHLEQEDPLVLDLCAAPGGKSLDVLNVLRGRGMLLANETIRSRNTVLQENLSKWGATNVAVSNNEAADLAAFGGIFDCVLVDAPCSGEGLFRKDIKARDHWSPEAVTFCASRQRRILTDILPAVAVGGLLIYSTCTFSSAENEGQFELIRSHGFDSLSLDLDPDWGVETVENEHGRGYAFLPHRCRGEGFFIAAFRRSSEAPVHVPRHMESLTPYEDDLSGVGIGQEISRSLWQRGEAIVHFPLGQLPRLEMLSELARLTAVGVTLATLSKGRIAPAHGAALSPGLLGKASRIPLSREESLRYLRGETFSLTEMPNGYYLAEHEGASLGWIKVAAGRMKNHYPKGWRIRKELRALMADQ